ncbi:ATG12 Ubiquitin-like protein ATG12 [Candida maltosa Xu316]
MSRMVQSEDDESSSLSSSTSSVKNDQIQIENEQLPTKVPLSTSIILEKKLSQDQQQQMFRHTPNQKEEDSKIMIRFVPIGSTPSIHPRVFKISSSQTISTLNKFLSKKLKHKELLHLYIQSSFSPLPDERIGTLYELFKTNNELIISYCNTIAFG